MHQYKIDENLEARLVDERYAEELYGVVRRNFDYLRRWLPWVTDDFAPETARVFLKTRLEDLAEKKELNLLIFPGGGIKGVISLCHIDHTHRSGEIGYWLAEDAQGRGVMTKCCRLMTEYGFEKLNLNRIVIKCATENFKSQAIPERLGFTKEGVLRQAERLSGGFVDLIVYSILKEEWETFSN